MDSIEKAMLGRSGGPVGPPAAKPAVPSIVIDTIERAAAGMADAPIGDP